MNINGFIRKICADNKTSIHRLGAGIGLTSGGMYNLSHSNGMSLKTLSRICEFFDYELVVRPKSDADREAKIIILESEQSKDINGSLIVKDDEFQRSQRSTEKDEMLKLFESLTEEQQAAILVTIKAMLK